MASGAVWRSANRTPTDPDWRTVQRYAEMGTDQTVNLSGRGWGYISLQV